MTDLPFLQQEQLHQKNSHASIIYAPATSTIAIERTLLSSTTLKNNNQPTMVIQEDVVGNGGASKVGKWR
jgi:hypothetical protein